MLLGFVVSTASKQCLLVFFELFLTSNIREKFGGLWVLPKTVGGSMAALPQFDLGSCAAYAPEGGFVNPLADLNKACPAPLNPLDDSLEPNHCASSNAGRSELATEESASHKRLEHKRSLLTYGSRLRFGLHGVACLLRGHSSIRTTTNRWFWTNIKFCVAFFVLLLLWEMMFNSKKKREKGSDHS